MLETGSMTSMTAVAWLQGAKVKKGQALAFIEQLGTFVPVEVRLNSLFSTAGHPF